MPIRRIKPQICPFSTFSEKSFWLTGVMVLILFFCHYFFRGPISEIVLILIFESFLRGKRCLKSQNCPFFSIFRAVCLVIQGYLTHFLRVSGSISIEYTSKIGLIQNLRL